MTDFLENETAMVSMLVTAATGLLTGPVFRMDPAAVGSITAAVVAVFNIWVRYSVYSKRGAATVATAAATEAVAAVTDTTAGLAGQVTSEGAQAVSDAVENVMGDDGIKPPGDEPRGGAGLIALLVIGFLVLLVIGGFAFLDLLIDDESEPGDSHFGGIELVTHKGSHT